jgi:GAF domain-containing protein
MHLPAPYAGGVVDETAQAEPAGLALLAELRASLLERCSLAAHEVLAPEGVPFSRVRAGCEQALEAVERSLRDPHRAPFSSLVLEREVAGCIQGGLSFVSLVRALQRAFVELGTQVAGASLEAAEAVIGAAGGLMERVGVAAAAELDTTHRASLRRRAAIADRVRAAASLLAGVALDLDRVLDAISRATAEGLACDWAAVAVREPDGRLVIAASAGRGVGWVQRWNLRADGGFAARALTNEGAAIASEPGDIPFEGDGGPSAVLAFALRDADRASVAVVFCGRDSGEALASEDLALADGIAEIAGRALEAAHAAVGARRLSAQLAALDQAAAAAGEGDDARALALLARVAAELARADAVLVRILDTARGVLVARAVHVDAPALEAEVTGTSAPVDGGLEEALRGREAELDAGLEPAIARRLQSRGATTALALPIGGASGVVGVLEILRAGPDPFSEAERQLLRHVAAQAALALSRAGGGADTGLPELLDIAGEALAAASDAAAAARVAARLASGACRADSALLHSLDEDGLHVLAAFGSRLADPVRQGPLDALALEALRHDDAIVTGGDGSAPLAGGIGAGAVLSVVLRARGEALGVLQLLFSERERADAAAADVALTVFATRVAEALAAARAGRRVAVELADARALCDAVAPAGEPSTQRALEAALRLTRLTTGGVWARAADGALREVATAGGGAEAAALVAALLDEAGGAPALRGDLASDARLAPLARSVNAGSAVIIPLSLRDLDVGVLAMLSPSAQPPGGAAEVALRVAGVTAAVLAADEQRRMAEQTARGARASEITARSVAVRLEAHEALADAALEGGDPDGVFAAAAARIAMVSTCAVQRLRDDGTLAPAALHVEGNALRDPVGRVLGRPLDAKTAVVARALAGEVVVLDADDGDAGPLASFVQSGSSAALVPLGPPGAIRGVVVLVSLDPTRPVTLAAAQAVRRLGSR